MALLKELYRRAFPARLRQRIRRVAHEIPTRLRDGPADLRDHMRADPMPFPPARLRARVGIDSSRAHFDAIGGQAAADLLDVFPRLGLRIEDFSRWLDFGCGAGRAARHLAMHPAIERLTGVDVDAAAVHWAARHLRDEYAVIASSPPMPYPDAAFDVVYAISVFTHFDERQQHAWLGELQRLLRPGGVFIATTHGTHLTANRPDMSADQHLQLQRHGFVFQRGFGAFNDDSAFHDPEYLRREWARYFELLWFQPAGLVNYLDLSVWRRGAE